ncbi:MAG: tyrosine-type recombinase/integrase [Phycisphaerales bacterium]
MLSEITPGLVQEYRVVRAQPSVKAGKLPDWKMPRVPSRSTMHKEIVTLRQVLRTAHRHGWLQHMPDLTPPYKTSGKITHRAWFSPKEYEQLYKATRKRAKNPNRRCWKQNGEDLHDFVLFMVNTGLRPDEAWNLQDRDAVIVEDEATGERIVEIEVRGKRGIGYCKSMPGAVLPLERLRKRNNSQPTDLIFPNRHRELFNAILEEEGLKVDRDGNRRTAYSLRHTYICLRLMEGADIYQIAKNCRTSVEMIETYYASHIKTTLDAAAINVRRPKPPARARSKKR